MTVWTAAVLVVLAVVAIATPQGVTQSIREVFVTNWPDVQQVRGTVQVDGPVRLSKMVRKERLIVPPVSPKDFTRLQPVATVETDGFAQVVLSILGQAKGEVYKPGTVGAILIPDVETARNAFFEKGQYLFPLEVTAAGVSSAAAYFASEQPRYQVGFSRYQVVLYNTTDKSVEVDLYAYLTN